MAYENRPFQTGTPATPPVAADPLVDNTSLGDAQIIKEFDPTAGSITPLIGQKARAGSKPVTLATEDIGEPITGQSLEAGGSGLFGWLASLRKAITDRLPAALVGGRLAVDATGSVALDSASLAALETVSIANFPGTQPVSGTVTATGNVASGAADSGDPLKIGGKASTSVPAPVANGARVDAYYDEYGRQVVSDRDVETGLTVGTTSLRDRLFAQRHTVLSDSLADGLAGFWTSTTANGGTTTSSGGEGLIQTSAGPTGSAQLSSPLVPYLPGQVGWFNSAVRFNDTGSANNTRRIGVFTVSGTTPQDGFYYELSGTTLNAVVAKAGVATAVASTSWSRVTEAPFTLDTSYHSFEIRFTANTVLFYVDNVLRHRVSGTTASITSTLNFPITIQSINTSGASNRLLAVRNCGIGRFGEPAQPVAETGLSAVNAIAVGGGTPHDSVDSGNPVKMGGRAQATAPTAVADGDRVNAWFSRNGALVVNAEKGTPTFTAAAPTTSATLLLAANTSRKSALLYNNGSQVVYLGGSGVTTSTGQPVPPGGAIADGAGAGAWYGITATGTGDIRVTEVA